MLTAHGSNNWLEVHKCFYLNKVIKTNIVDTLPANISGSESLCDDFSAAAHHVSEFLVRMKSSNLGSNCYISSVDNDQGGGGSWGSGVGPGPRGKSGGGRHSCDRSGHGVPPQDAVEDCTNITKSYYPADQYIRFSAEDKQRVWQNKVKQPRAVGKNICNTYPIKELNVHIHQLSAIIKIQNKRIFHIETNNGNEDSLDSGNDKSVLNRSNRNKPALVIHGKVIAKRTTVSG